MKKEKEKGFSALVGRGEIPAQSGAGARAGPARSTGEKRRGRVRNGAEVTGPTRQGEREGRRGQRPTGRGEPADPLVPGDWAGAQARGGAGELNGGFNFARGGWEEANRGEVAELRGGSRRR
jgi:hypothetical protein